MFGIDLGLMMRLHRVSKAYTPPNYKNLLGGKSFLPPLDVTTIEKNHPKHNHLDSFLQIVTDSLANRLSIKEPFLIVDDQGTGYASGYASCFPVEDEWLEANYGKATLEEGKRYEAATGNLFVPRHGIFFDRQKFESLKSEDIAVILSHEAAHRKLQHTEKRLNADYQAGEAQSLEAASLGMNIGFYGTFAYLLKKTRRLEGSFFRHAGRYALRGVGMLLRSTLVGGLVALVAYAAYRAFTGLDSTLRRQELEADELSVRTLGRKGPMLDLDQEFEAAEKQDLESSHFLLTRL